MQRREPIACLVGQARPGTAGASHGSRAPVLLIDPRNQAPPEGVPEQAPDDVPGAGLRMLDRSRELRARRYLAAEPILEDRRGVADQRLVELLADTFPGILRPVIHLHVFEERLH